MAVRCGGPGGGVPEPGQAAEEASDDQGGCRQGRGTDTGEWITGRAYVLRGSLVCLEGHTRPMLISAVGGEGNSLEGT